MLKWHGKIVKYELNFVNFQSCYEKRMKVGQTLSRTLTNVHGLCSKCSILIKFHLISFHLWPKSFSSHKYQSYLLGITSSYRLVGYLSFTLSSFTVKSLRQYWMIRLQNEGFKSLTRFCHKGVGSLNDKYFAATNRNKLECLSVSVSKTLDSLGQG